MESRRTWFDATGVRLAGGVSIPWHAASLPYWKIAPSAWPAELRRLRDLGLSIVETFVPWRLHETSLGTFAWTGDLDLPRFLVAAKAAGIGVALRVGPRSDEELPCFGFPDHVLRDRSATTDHWMPSPPRAWPIPNYGSDAFRAHVRRWFTELARVIEKDLVVAIGVDHFAQHFFRVDVEYDEPKALGEFAKLLDDVGFTGIARFHDAPPMHYGRLESVAIQRAIGGPVGLSACAAREDFAELARRARACAGKAEPLPIAIEIRSTIQPWLPPLVDDPTRARDQLLVVLGYCRGFHVTGGAAGNPDRHDAWLGKLVAALREVDHPSLRRRAPIALVDTRADDKPSVLHPIAPAIEDALGIGEHRWQTAICRALELAQVGYDIVDESASIDALASYRAVIVPTQTRVDPALWETLRAIADAKRAIVVIGPGNPVDVAPIKRLGRIRPGSLEDIPGLAQDLAALVDPEETWLVERPESVRIEALFDAGGVARFVVATSDTSKATTAIVRAVGVALRDVFTNEQIAIRDGVAAIPMPARGVRAFVVGN